MASGSNVYVGSDVLTDLQNNLRSLSDSLENLFQTMVEQMNSVSSFWQDAKYEEFKAGYSGHIAKCHDIANNYNSWATGVLQNTINRVVEVEKTDVSGSSISGGAAASAVGATNVGAGISTGGSAVGTAAVGSTIGSNFNLGSQTKPNQNSSPKSDNSKGDAQGEIHYNHYSWVEEKLGMPRDAEEKCIDAHGRKWSPVSKDVAEKYSGSFEVRDTPQEKELHGGKFGGTMEGKVGASAPLEVASVNAQVGASVTAEWENKSEKNWDSIHCMNQDDIDKINKMNGH